MLICAFVFAIKVTFGKKFDNFVNKIRDKILNNGNGVDRENLPDLADTFTRKEIDWVLGHNRFSQDKFNYKCSNQQDFLDELKNRKLSKECDGPKAM